MASLYAWLPDLASASDEDFVNLVSWKGMALRWPSPGIAEGGDGIFSGTYWSRLTAEHWEVPLAAVAVYIFAIPLLKCAVSRHGKLNVRTFAFWWNALLSVFSWCVLLTTLQEHGLFFTTCAPAAWYGSGVHGMFIALFVYSKIAELLDTVLVLLARKPVIALQWWHHSAVLLYCWHSYAVRIATGAWFACMNYSVHSIMYGYFAVTGTKYRKAVVPYAIYITLLQLLQMLVGMFVTVKAVMHQAAGEECHVNKTNSVLGLTMYASYVVLFFKLFVDNYYLKPKGPKKQASVRDAMRSVSRNITQIVDDDGNEEDKDKQEQLGEETEQKKVN